MFSTVYKRARAHGIAGLLRAAATRIVPRRIASYPLLAPSLRSRVGLEIGGPSRVFMQRGLIPVYPIAARIDNCNFGRHTTWEGNIKEGSTFRFDKRKSPGRQFVVEATHLDSIPSASYDFVLSSHCLEHIANPLLALEEWSRVLDAEGLLLLIVPHRDGTFDHRRPVTRMEHLLEDRARRTTEADSTHLEEILKLHDLSKDPKAGDAAAFRRRSMKNSENRCLHHHVFDTRLAVKVVDQVGLQILHVELFRPYHIVVIARKPIPGQAPKNDAFLGIDTPPSWRSPFPSDRATNPQ